MNSDAESLRKMAEQHRAEAAVCERMAAELEAQLPALAEDIARELPRQ